MKKNMKRILSLWLALILVAIGVAGCGSDPAETTAGTSTTETTATETTKATETTASATATEVSETTSTETTATETKATETSPRMTEMTPPTETTATETTATETTAPITPPDVHILRLVYLGTDAQTVYEADLTGSSFLVKTDRPACAMDGTVLWPIFHRYDTTSETYLKKLTDNSLYTEIVPGRFYLTETDGEIVRELPSLIGFSTVTKKNVNVDSYAYDYSYELPVFTGEDLADGEIFRAAVITSVSGGKILARLGDDEKTTDITDWNVKFIYADVDGKALHTAGNGTQVNPSSFDTMVSALETLYDEAAKAKIVYETVRDGRIVDGVRVTYADETVAYYRGLWEHAEEELAAAKESALDKRMNGAFWGKDLVTGSPLAAYFDKVKTSFGRDASLSFVYFTVDDVHYVFATTFVLQ